MAVTLIAGLASAAGHALAISAFTFSWAAFAIGAGLSLVSRALMPKLDAGSQMGGRSVTTREAAHSRKIIYGRARIGGNIVYLESTGTDNKYLWLVVAVAGHEVDAFESVWFNDNKIWGDGNYFNNWGSFVSISFYKGDQTAADSALVSASSKWTTDHKLLDTAYMVLKLTYDVDKFAQGLPNISTIIRGKKVFNPSDNSTAWSDNPALCAYDYLRDTKYGLGETAANILTASVTTAKGVCDETVSLAAGGTQKRYTINGVVDTANSIKSNIEQMLGSMIGRLVYSGGQFEIHAGAYVAPAFTVDESVAVGEITVQTKQSRRNAYNAVKGVMLSVDDNYILADYPAQVSKTVAGSFVVGKRYQILVINNTDFTAIGASSNTVGVDFTATGVGSGTGTASLFLAQDGQQIFLDMALPFTTNNIRAQRIARLALLRSRQQEAITIPCNLSALRFKVGENINVTNARLGYNNKIFEVVGYSMDFASDGQIVVNVDAIETASSIWAWATSDEEVFLGGGEVALYDGTVAVAPTSINVTSDSFLSDDGTFNSQFNVAWTNAADAFTDHYIVEWKLASVSNYFSQTTKSTPFSIVNLVNNASYNVRVKAVNEIGVSSAYLSATPTSAIDTTAPSVPSSISATAGFQSISLQWTNPSQKDFINVEVYRATSSGGTYVEVSNVASGYSAKVEHLDGDLADATAYHYKLKSVDFTGNKSAFSGIVTATTYKIDTANIADDAVETAQIADEAVQTDQIDDDAVTIAKIATSLQSTNYSSGSAGWKIQKSGVVEFEEATIRGEIVASTGVIGGFTVGSTSLIAGTGATRVSLSTADGIHLGNNTFGSAPFRVTRAGALTASSATITGALTLTNVDGTTVNYSGGNLQVGTVQTANIANDAINNAKIAVDAIQGDVIAAGAIVSAKLGVDAVTSAKIADNAVVTAAINDNAITNALIATDAVNSDSIVANAVTAVTIAAGAITTAKITAGAVVAGSIAASAIIADKIAADAITANKIAANAVTADAIAANAVTANAIAANSIVASKIAADAITANKIDVLNLAAINADMGNITAGSISVGLLTGDVTDVYPVGLEIATSMGTSGLTTYADFWIPAPSSGIAKRQRISTDFVFSITNSSSSNYSAYFQYGLQYKGKTNIGTSIGAVTHVSFPIQYRQLVSLAGNVLDKIDNVGGVAKTNNGAGTYGVASIVGVSYDASANKTYVLIANIATTFATNDTMFFSANKFESAGTFVANYQSLQTKMILANSIERFTLPMQQYFGSTTTATNVRPYVIASTNMNNLTGVLQTLKGTMENLA